MTPFHCSFFKDFINTSHNFFLDLMNFTNLFVYLVSLDLEFMIDYISILYFFSTMDERLDIKEENFDAECSVPKHFTASKFTHIDLSKA